MFSGKYRTNPVNKLENKNTKEIQEKYKKIQKNTKYKNICTSANY